MPVKPKINSQTAEVLRDAYINKKMSTTEISEQSEKLFGVKISAGTIYKEIIRHGIPIRTKSESVSMASCTLDQNKSWMTQEMTEWLDGILLGDGGIVFNKDNFMGARIRMDSSCIEWTRYGMSGFKEYQPSEPKVYQKIDEKHPNPIWVSQTLTHQDIIQQAKRWYPNGSKIVPKDVKITPISTMLWFLGDGCLFYVEEINAAILKLSTCGFTAQEIKEILIPGLEKHDIRCNYETGKNEIRVGAESIKTFFSFIGKKSPIACYDYKFDYPEWLNLTRLSEIVKDDQEKWRAQYYCKNGLVDFSRSPGGKFFLFSDSQAKALRKKLDSE